MSHPGYLQKSREELDVSVLQSGQQEDSRGWPSGQGSKSLPGQLQPVRVDEVFAHVAVNPADDLLREKVVIALPYAALQPPAAAPAPAPPPPPPICLAWIRRRPDEY